MYRKSCCRQVCMLVAVCLTLLVGQIGVVRAATVLFHGNDAGPTAGADGAVFTRLQSLYGASNVTYMQGSAAAADGSSAAGYDAVIISSTISSSDCRNKYEDATQGVMTWEAALAKDDTGDLQMFETHYSGAGHTQIDIVDETHPLAAGLSGTVTVTTVADMMQYGRDGLGEGVDLVASTTIGGDHAILAADLGDPLLGDGSAGNPSVAAGRRVMFFLHDSTFANLTADGLKLFDAAVAYALALPAYLHWMGGTGLWDEPNTDLWTDGTSNNLPPAANNNMIINADTNDSVVTVATDFTTAVGGGPAASVTVGETNTASLIVNNGVTLEVTGEVYAGDSGTLQVDGMLTAASVVCHGILSGDGGTIEADFIEIAGVVSPGSSVGMLTIDGELELIEGTYLCEIDSTGADLIHNANQDEAIVLGEEQQGGTLVLEPLEALGDPGCYTETILSTSGAGEIVGDFAVKPAEGDYLAYGVFLEAYEVPDPAVAYTLNLFQAGQGDTDGDGDVDLDDLSALDDGWDPTAEDKIWTDGDVDGDGDVDLDDLSLLDDNWAPAGYPLVNCPFGGGVEGLGSAPVPEPGTFALLAMGLVALMLWRRYRRPRRD